MKHGEIRWYNFLAPDKKQQVLILTRDSVLEYPGEVTIAPITTTVYDIPSEVFFSTIDGMPKNCAVNLIICRLFPKGNRGFDHILAMDENVRGRAGNPFCTRYLKEELPNRQ